MKGIERLASVDSTTPRMARALPDMPMSGTVLVRLIRISAFGMGNFFEPVFRSLGLSEHSFHVLCLLIASENGSASPSELSEMVGTSRANMTHILEDLVGAGLASRTIAARDARRHVIAITTAGRRKVRETVPQIAGPILRGFSGLSAAEMAQLDKLLRKLIVSFDQGAHALRAAA